MTTDLVRDQRRVRLFAQVAQARGDTLAAIVFAREDRRLTDVLRLIGAHSRVCDCELTECAEPAPAVDPVGCTRCAFVLGYDECVCDDSGPEYAFVMGAH